MDRKKLFFWLIWLVIVSLGPITVLRVTPFSTVVSDRVLLVNFFQRIFGLVAFSMILFQIILGSFMTKWIEKLGAWVFRFHVVEGLVIYTLLILHPLTLVVINYFIGKGVDPFYVFVDVCLLCENSLEWFYNFGRIGFWLVTTAVIAALFRASTPFLRIHWQKFHTLNYLAFFVIWFHSFKLGTDIGTFPFSIIHGPSLVVAIAIVTMKNLKPLRYF